MASQLLSIIIPTYNRADNLELLLNGLVQELKDLQHQVKVIIGNNYSTDRTATVIENFRKETPTSIVLNHEKNLGAEENFCCCLDQVTTRFFWMIGDDDFPKSSVIRKVVKCLEDNDPDLLYLNSSWTPQICYANDESLNFDVSAVRLSRLDFAQQVNVWITFISGMVVNNTRLQELNPEIDIRRFSGTYLVQLGWILPLLMSGSRFLMIKQRCVLATSGNTGGYELLKVFSTNFPKILDEVCGENSEEKVRILDQLIWHFLPGLAWGARFSGNKKFAVENRLESIKPIRGRIAYWLLILPIATLPLPISLIFYAFSKLLTLMNTRIHNIACRLKYAKT